MKSYFLESNSVVAIYITCAKYDFGTAKLMEKHQLMLGKERYKSNNIEKGINQKNFAIDKPKRFGINKTISLAYAKRIKQGKGFIMLNRIAILSIFNIDHLLPL
jgi:hypothetical protein